eukprot:753626-Hanusia_phi.AAC.5
MMLRIIVQTCSPKMNFQLVQTSNCSPAQSLVGPAREKERKQGLPEPASDISVGVDWDDSLLANQGQVIRGQ